MRYHVKEVYNSWLNGTLVKTLSKLFIITLLKKTCIIAAVRWCGQIKNILQDTKQEWIELIATIKVSFWSKTMSWSHLFTQNTIAHDEEPITSKSLPFLFLPQVSRHTGSHAAFNLISPVCEHPPIPPPYPPFPLKVMRKIRKLLAKMKRKKFVLKDRRALFMVESIG